MRWARYWGKIATGLALLAALAASWTYGLEVINPFTMKDDAAASQVQAAWVQAVTSIVGIGIAMWIPYQLFKKEKAERDEDKVRQARSSALQIEPAILSLSSRLAFFLGYQVKEENVDIFGEEARLAAEIPQSLTEFTTRLPELGDIGTIVQQLLYSLRGIDTLLNTHDVHLQYGTSWSAKNQAELESTFKQASSQAVKALDLIHKLFE